MKTGRQTPSVAQLERYNVQNLDNLEGIWNPLYHFQAYAAAGQSSLTFFQTPQGQGGLTYDDTNMQSAGQMPAGQNFLCVGIEVVFYPGTAPAVNGVPGGAGHLAALKSINDVWSVMKTGRLRFYVGSKDYLIDGPIGVFPAQHGIEGVAAANGSTAADTLNTLVNAAAIRGPAYQITPIRLTSNLNFAGYLEWGTSTVGALPSGVAGRIGMRLLGFQYRKSQ